MIRFNKHKKFLVLFAVLISFFISALVVQPSVTKAADSSVVDVLIEVSDPIDGQSYGYLPIKIQYLDENGKYKDYQGTTPAKSEVLSYDKQSDGATAKIRTAVTVANTITEQAQACIYKQTGEKIGCKVLTKPTSSGTIAKYGTGSKNYSVTLKATAAESFTEEAVSNGKIDVTVIIEKDDNNEDMFDSIPIYLYSNGKILEGYTQNTTSKAGDLGYYTVELKTPTFVEILTEQSYKACIADAAVCSTPEKYLGPGKTISLTINLTQEQAKTVAVIDTQPSCTIDGVGWIVCPVSNFLAKMADGAFHFISGTFLEIKSQTFDTSSSTYQAWSAMRNIANVLFVIVFMVIVISQMSGFGITNYGVKKMLPRLIVAAILVNVSYFICQIAIDISNIVGYSLDGLFKGFATSSIGSPDPMTDGDFFLSLVGGILGATGALIFAALSITIPMIIAAVVALMMIVFLLVARQAIVVLLVVVAPIAFVAYLLPNTNNLFKQWKKIFTSMLLLFPIVALVFGASSLAAAILSKSFEDSGSVWIGPVVVAAINVLPLFAVPVLLKKSLDGVGNIGSTINGLGDKWGKGLGSKYSNSDLAKYRAQQKANRSDAIKAGAYDEKGRNPFKAFNRFKSNRYGEFNDSELSGNFGTRRAAIGAGKLSKQDAEMVSDAAALIKIKSNPTDLIKDAQKAFDNAVISGDTTKARAAQNILLTTAPGREALHTSYLKQNVASSFEQNTSLASSLRADINGAGLKGSDVALATLGYTADSLANIQKSKETYKLTPSEIINQSETTITTMIKSGALSSEAADEILKNPNLVKDLTNTKLDLLKSARDNTLIGTALNAKTWQDVETKVNENNAQAQDGNTFTDGSGI